MLKKAIYGLVLVVSACAAGAAFAGSVPSMHEVEAAAQAGRLNDAHGMMQQVLKEHPDSAKAHFVDAEILAKMGRTAEARDQLNAAEKLKPGLPFAKPHAVDELRAKLGQTRPAAVQPQAQPQPQVQQQARPTPVSTQQAAHNADGFPWAALIAAIGGLVLVIVVIRLLSRPNAPQPYGSNYQGNPAGQPNGYHPGMNLGGGYAPASSGMGSGILSGLATGAAVGAGMVAGEALAHHFMDGKSGDSSSAPSQASTGNYDNSYSNSNNSDSSYDMGGTDFGVNDDSSWSDNTAVADNSSSWSDSSGGGSDGSGGDDWT